MPTVLIKNGFRFFFYSDEGYEPAHIHVEKGDAIGKIWLEPEIEIDFLNDFTSAEIKQKKIIVSQYFVQFKTKWHEYFQQ